MVDVKTIAKDIFKGAKDNLPAICTGMAVVGVWTTAMSSGIDTLRAKDKMDRYIQELRNQGCYEDPSWWDYVRVCGPCYISTAISGLVTSGSAIAAMKVSDSRNLALAGLAGVAQNGMATYAEKVVETIGEKKEKDIRESVTKEQGKKILEKVYPSGQISMELIEARDYIVVDVPTQQVGIGNSNKIVAAENETNRKILKTLDGEATVEEFLMELGDPDHFKSDHPLCKYPNGFNLDHPLKVDITVDEWHGVPAYYMNYKIWNLMTNTPVLA